MTPEKLAFLKEQLLTMEQELIDNIVGESSEEENPYTIDGDLADKAEALSTVSLNEGLSNTQKKTLEKIRIALQRIKEGTYGKCSVCSAEISNERLEAVPYADKCRKHMVDQ